MNEPFLRPSGLEGRSCNAAKPVDDLRQAERSEAVLHLGVLVWVHVAQDGAVLVEDSLGQVVHAYDGCVEKGLDQEVVVTPLAEITAVADIAGRRVPGIV